MIDANYYRGVQDAFSTFKLAFDERDIDKVFQRSKAVRAPQGLVHEITIPSGQTIGKRSRGISAITMNTDPRGRVPVSSDVLSLHKAVNPTDATPLKDLKESLLEGATEQLQDAESAFPAIKGLRRAVPNTSAPLLLSGDAFTGVRDMADLTGHPLPKLTGPQRRAFNALVHAHELDEAAAMTGRKSRLAFGNMGHASPEVILKEHNRIVTLPEHLRPAGQALATIRKPVPRAPVPFGGPEGRALEGLVDIGRSARLSRHARKHITNLVHNRFLQKL